MTPEETASALPDGDEAATSAPSLLAFPDWLEQNQATIKEPLAKYRGYSDYVKQETLAQGRYSDTFVDKLDTKLAGLAVESGDYPLAEGQTQYVPAEVLARPKSDDIPIDSLLRKAYSSDTPEDDLLRGAVAKYEALRRLRDEGHSTPEEFAAAEADLRQLATPEVLNAATRKDVKDGFSLAMVVPPATEGGAPDVFVNKSLLEFVNPEDRSIDTAALGKALKMKGTDPSLIPAILAKLTTPAGYGKTVMEMEMHGDDMSTLDTLARTADADRNYKLYEELGKIATSRERGNSYAAEFGEFRLKQLTKGTPLEGKDLMTLADDFNAMNAMPEIDEANPTAALRTMSTGQVVAPLNLMLDDAKFATALKSVPLAQQEHLKAQRDYAVTVSAADTITALADSPEYGEAFTEYMDTQRSAGKTDAEIVKGWVAKGEFSATRSTLGGIQSSLGEAIMPFVYLATGADPDGFAMKAMQGAQIEDSDRRAYAELFGHKHGIGYDLGKLAAPMAADIGAAFLTRGASVVTVGGAKMAAGAAVRRVLQTALTAETRSLTQSWLRTTTTALAKSGAKDAGLQFTGRETVKDVISMAGRDITSKVTSGVGKAAFYGTAFNRSATSTYASLSTSLSNQKNPDGSQKYSPEEVKEISMTHAIAAGAITVGAMGAMAGLGAPGIEKIFGEAGKTSAGQMSRIMGRLKKDVSKLPAGIDTTSANTMISSFVREGLKNSIFKSTVVRGAVEEIPEEALDTFMGYFNEKMATGERVNIPEALRGAMYAGMLGGVMGGTVTGISGAIQNRTAPPAQVEAEIRRERLLDMAAKLEATSPQTAQVFRNYAFSQRSMIPQRQQLEADLKAAKTPEAKAEIQTKIDTLNEQSTRPATDRLAPPAEESVPEADAAEGDVPPPSDAGVAPEGEAVVEGTPEGSAAGAGVAASPAVQAGKVAYADAVASLKAKGVDVKTLSREDFADAMASEGHTISDSQLRKSRALRDSEGTIGKLDLKHLTQPLIDLADSVKSGAKKIAGIRFGEETAGWVHYHVGSGTRSASGVKVSSQTPKTYITVKEGSLNTALTPANMAAFMGELGASGINGQVKHAASGTALASYDDQIVFHGATRADADAAAKLAEKFFGTDLEQTTVGVDAQWGSYSQVVEARANVKARGKSLISRGRLSMPEYKAKMDKAVADGELQGKWATSATFVGDMDFIATGVLDSESGKMVTGKTAPAAAPATPPTTPASQTPPATRETVETEFAELVEDETAPDAVGTNTPPVTGSNNVETFDTEQEAQENAKGSAAIFGRDNYAIIRNAEGKYEVHSNQFDDPRKDAKWIATTEARDSSTPPATRENVETEFDNLVEEPAEKYSIDTMMDRLKSPAQTAPETPEVSEVPLTDQTDSLPEGQVAPTGNGAVAPETMADVNLRHGGTKTANGTVLPPKFDTVGKIVTGSIADMAARLGIEERELGEGKFFDGKWKDYPFVSVKVNGQAVQTWRFSSAEQAESFYDWIGSAGDLFNPPSQAPSPTTPTDGTLPGLTMPPRKRSLSSMRDATVDKLDAIDRKLARESDEGNMGVLEAGKQRLTALLGKIENVMLAEANAARQELTARPLSASPEAIVEVAEAENVTMAEVVKKARKPKAAKTDAAETPLTPEALYGSIKETKALKTEKELSEISKGRKNPDSKWYRAAKSETTKRQQELESLRSDNYADWGIAVDALDAEIEAKNPIAPVWGELLQQLRLPASELPQRLQVAGYVKQGEIYIYQPNNETTPQIPFDSRDTTYEGLLKKGIPAGPNMVELTEKQVTPATRNKLRSDRDTQRGSLGRPEETPSFYLRPKADVTGVPTDRGWILKDKRPDFIARSQSAPTPAPLSPRAMQTLLSAKRIGDFSGPSNADARAAIMSEIAGKKIPKAKAGVNAFVDAVAAHFGVSREGKTTAGYESDVTAAIRKAAEPDTGESFGIEGDTPMLRQYKAIKRTLPKGSLLAYRVGDFYEFFGDDARTTAPLMEVALTKRNGVPMSGVPYFSAKNYFKKLTDAGNTVAVSDQPSDVKPGQRKVTEILSPETTPTPTETAPYSFDLSAWVETNYPQEASASRYLSPTAQYNFHIKVWEAAGRPQIESEPAPETSAISDILADVPEGYPVTREQAQVLAAVTVHPGGVANALAASPEAREAAAALLTAKGVATDGMNATDLAVIGEGELKADPTIAALAGRPAAKDVKTEVVSWAEAQLASLQGAEPEKPETLAFTNSAGTTYRIVKTRKNLETFIKKAKAMQTGTPKYVKPRGKNFPRVDIVKTDKQYFGRTDKRAVSDKDLRKDDSIITGLQDPEYRAKLVKRLSESEVTQLEDVILAKYETTREELLGDTRSQPATAQNAVQSELDKFGISDGITAFLTNVAKRGGKQYGSLAQLLLDAGAGNVDVRIVNLPNTDAAGFYVGANGVVHINTARNGPRGAVDTVLHELVHAVTEGSLKNPTPAQAKVIAKISRVRATVIKRAKAQGVYTSDLEYALGSNSEFLTHFFTSQRFRDQVSSMTPKSEKNWLQVIADLIADLVHGRLRTEAERMSDSLRKDLTTLITAPRIGLAPMDVILRLPANDLRFQPSNRKALRVRLTREALTGLALDQASWKDWYSQHQETLDEFFGDHAEMFQDILAATSQAATVKSNVGLALKAFGQIIRGEPIEGFLPAVRSNLERLRDKLQLEGQKISAYQKANAGDIEQVVVDRHISRMLFGVDSPSKAQFEKGVKVLSDIARKIGWKPSQVQAALWAASIVKSGKTPQSYADYLRKLEGDGVVQQRIGIPAGAGTGSDGGVGRRGRYSPGVQPDGGIRLQPATARDVARFNQLTESLYQGRSEATATEIDTWREANPDAWAELSRMRETVLREMGYDVETFRGQEDSQTTLGSYVDDPDTLTVFSTTSRKAAELYNNNVKRFFVKNPRPFTENANFRPKGEVFNVEDIKYYVENGNHTGAVIYDVIDIPDDIEESMSTREAADAGYAGDLHILFNPEQIKSAEPISPGQKITPDQWADAGSSDIRFQPAARASDAEYLAAVEAGDMETAQRIVYQAAAASKHTEKGHRAGVYKNGVPLMPSTTGGLGSAYYAVLGGNIEETKEFAGDIQGPNRNDPSLKAIAGEVMIDLGDKPLFVKHPTEVLEWARKNNFLSSFKAWMNYQFTVNKAYDAIYEGQPRKDWNAASRRIDVEPNNLEARRAGRLYLETAESKKEYREARIKDGYTEEQINERKLNEDTVETSDASKLNSFLFDQGHLTAIVVDWAGSAKAGMPSGDGRMFTEVAVANPSQIKSADPITYDNNGNVIPLSQRFQSTSPDIRFQPAARASDAEYLAAVEAGDMETAQRIVYQAAGVDTQLWDAPPQTITSADTSINDKKTAATFTKVKFAAGTINADIGGGRFDNATIKLKAQGVRNVIFDPFNRREGHNMAAASRIRDGQSDTTTVNNVLNVIQDAANRDKVIRQAANAVKPDGTSYFLVYEGNGSGVGRVTSKGWQTNRKTKDYLDEIKAHYGNVRVKNGIIEATNPIKGRYASEIYYRADIPIGLGTDPAISAVSDFGANKGQLRSVLRDDVKTKDLNYPNVIDRKPIYLTSSTEDAYYFASSIGYANDIRKFFVEPGRTATPEDLNRVFGEANAKGLRDANGNEFFDTKQTVSYLTPDEVDLLVEAGYDSAAGQIDGRGGKEVAVFYPSQIKSADPVTRDKQGNVIPLSQRFQSTSPDIRFQPAASLVDKLVEKGHTMLREDFDAEVAKLKPMTRDVFYVGDIEVVRNPTSADYQTMSKEVRSEFGRDPGGDPDIRFTQDQSGNRWIWKAHQGMHSQVEPAISRREGVEVNQNANPPSHSEVVRQAIRDTKFIPDEVKAQYPQYAEFFDYTPTDIRFQGLTEQDFTPASLRDTATGFLPDDVTLDDLAIDFADLADIVEGLTPVNAENVVHAKVNHALARRAGEAAIPAPARSDFDSDEAFDTATREHAAEVKRLTDTYELITRGRLTSEAMFRYRTNPGALTRLVDYLTAAIKAAYNRFTARYDVGTAVALNRMSRDLARARKGFNHDIEPMAVYDPDEVLLLLPAYHGTPHNVIGGFTTDKIGTGEGAQAFGWGLYFTQTEDIARGYSKISPRGGDTNIELIKAAKEWLASQDIDIKEYQATGWDDASLPTLAEEFGWDKPSGNLYNVDIKIEDDEMLDWDKALSEQSGKVKAKLGVLWEDLNQQRERNAPGMMRPATGGDLYQHLEETLAEELDAAQDNTPAAQAASKRLNNLGIPGIRYMDGVSRNRPYKDIKRDFLNALPEDAEFEDVQDAIDGGDFNPDQVTFLQALEADDWFGFDYPAQAISAALSDRAGNFEVSQALTDSIAALRGDATYNYVIFDGKDVEITHRNGEPIPQSEWAGLDPDNTSGIQFQPAAPQSTARQEQQLLNAEAPMQRVATLFKRDPGTKAGADITPSENAVIRRLTEFFVNPFGALSKSNTKSQQNRDAMMETVEYTVSSLSKRLDAARRKEDANPTAVQLAVGNIDPLLTPAMQEKIKEDFVNEVSDAEQEIEATYGEEVATNPIEAAENRAVALAEAHKIAERNRQKAIWSARSAEADSRRAQQLQALAQLEREAPDTYEAIIDLRGTVNRLQRLVKEANPDSPEIHAIVDQSFGVYLVRSYGIHQDPKQIDLMMNSQESLYKERREALTAFFKEKAFDEIMSELDKDPQFFKQYGQSFDYDKAIADMKRIAEAESGERAQQMFEDYMLSRQSARGTFGEGSTVTNEIQRYMAKANMPQEFLDALMVNEDPVFNIANTAMSLGRLVFNSRMLNEIHDSGIESGRLISEAEFTTGITYADGKEEMRRVFGTEGNDEVKLEVLDALVKHLNAKAQEAYDNGRSDTPPDKDALYVQAATAMQDFATTPNSQLSDILPSLGRKADRMATSTFILSKNLSRESKAKLQARPGRFAGWQPLVTTNVGNSAFKPLGGMYAEPEQVKAFNATFRINSNGIGHFADDFVVKAHRSVIAAAGASLLVATQGSPAYFVRNVVGNTFVGLMNGVTPFRPENITLAGRTFRSLINERGEPTAEMQELIAGRIVMDAAQIGYIKQLIEDYTGNPGATVEELVGESARADIKAGKLVKGSKKAAKAFMTKLSKLSEATEVLATVMIYADFKRILTEADFGTEIEIIQEASRLTKRVTPGRSETASGVTALTRSGFGALFAPFLRFKVDTVRVMVNSLKLAHEMSNSDNPVLKKHGRVKMASWYSTVGLLTIAMPLIFQRAFGGFGEDEDEAIRASLPDYYRNASLFYFRNSENNGLTIINSTFTNPLSFVGDPISRITNAVLFGDASDIPGILGRFVTEDFIGENIVASNTWDVMRNKDSNTNYPIYFKADSDGDKVLKSAVHLGKAYTPRLFIQGDRFVDALRREGDEEFWYSPLGVALATVAPFRPMSKTFDDMERAAFNNIRKENSELWRVTSPIFSPAPLAAGEATERYNERVTIMEKQARKALELYDGFAKIRGGDEVEVKRSAVNAGMSKRRATLLFNRGLMEKQVFPDDDLRRVREIDPARYDEIKAAMRERPSLSPIER